MFEKIFLVLCFFLWSSHKMNILFFFISYLTVNIFCFDFKYAFIAVHLYLFSGIRSVEVVKVDVLKKEKQKNKWSFIILKINGINDTDQLNWIGKNWQFCLSFSKKKVSGLTIPSSQSPRYSIVDELYPHCCLSICIFGKCIIINQ